MKKAKLIKINEYDYVFSDEKDRQYTINIEFYGSNLPKIGDVIYFPDKILDEKNIYAYGELKEDKNLEADDLIKVVSGEKQYYLQRYYG